MVSRAGGTTFVPPPGGSTTTTQTAKATLTIYVPRRGSTAVRKPSYVSPGTSTVTVSVFPAGAPSPWPLPTSTTVPTPAPVPSGVTPTAVPMTMTVNAPLGNAQFYVNTYDSNGYLLSGALSSPVPISPAAPNAVNMTLNASVQCIQINGAGGGLTVYPLADQATSQSATFVVTPCDIDGYVIPAGQTLANPLVFSVTRPFTAFSHSRSPQAALPTPSPTPTPNPYISFSPSTISTGGNTTVTVTYAAQSRSSATMYLVPGQAINNVTQYATINATTVSEILVVNRGDATVNVFRDDSSGTVTALVAPSVTASSSPSHIVGGSSMNGCAQAAQAAITNDANGSLTVLAIPTPPSITASAPPAPVVSGSNINTGFASSFGAEAIKGCTVYAAAGSSWGTLTNMTSFAAASSAPPATITSIGPLADIYLGVGGNNIFDGTASTLTVAGLSTDAIAPYDATHVVIAYHPSAGYLYFGLFDGTTITDTWVAPTNTTVTAMAADTNGNFYAIGGASPNNRIFDYIPLNAVGSAQSTLYGLYPSAVAVDLAHHILVTDTNGGSGNGTIDDYSNFGLTTMPVPTRFSVGSFPSGIAVVP